MARLHCGMSQIGTCRCVTRALVMCFRVKVRFWCEVIGDCHHDGWKTGQLQMIMKLLQMISFNSSSQVH